MKLQPEIVSGFITGEAKEYSKFIFSLYREIITKKTKKNITLLFGGETTVNLENYKNKGGRNQEIVLSFANELINNGINCNNMFFCSVGSDGVDGTTDAAGAYINDIIINRLKDKDVNQYLKEHRSYEILLETGALIKTGATGTNVCDFLILTIWI